MFSCPGSVARHWPVDGFHNFAVPSQLPLMRIDSFDELLLLLLLSLLSLGMVSHERDVTALSCPDSLWTS